VSGIGCSDGDGLSGTGGPAIRFEIVPSPAPAYEGVTAAPLDAKVKLPGWPMVLLTSARREPEASLITLALTPDSGC